MQKFGMSMGNPLSVLLNNLYMEFSVSNILCDIFPSSVKWYYVDTISLWPIDMDIKCFSSQFTLETETDSTLAFLDIKAHREVNKFKISIYRKPTTMRSCIHYYFSHHVKVKQSAISGMFLSALRICSPEYFDDEANTV